MKPWLRKALAMLAGVMAASLCVAGVEAAGHAILSGDAAFGAAVAGLGIGSLAGGAVAARLGGSAALAWSVGGLLAILSLVNVFSFAHPVWFVPTAAIVILAATFIAARAAPRPAT